MWGQKRQRRAWCDEKHVRAENLPAGPQNVGDLANWPLDVAKGLTQFSPQDKEIEMRLKAHALNGLNVYTDYSGIDCPRECLRLGFAGLSKLHGWKTSNPVTHSRSSDMDSACRDVLLEYAKHDSGCVFGNLLERLPAWAQDWIQSATPPSKLDIEQKRNMNKSIADWVSKNAFELFSDSATSWCFAHGCNCPAHPMLSRDLLKSYHPRPLMVAIAGVSCLPWTTEGSQEADASECEIPHCVWMNERKVRASKCQEDVAFVECTPRYPIEQVFAENLSETHVCVWAKVGPELCGWPHKRMRVVGAALNSKTVQWHGPVSQAEVQADFDQRFHKAVALNGDVFALASDEERFREYCFMALKQKNYLEPSDIGSIGKNELLRLMLPPGGVQRFNEWMDIAYSGSSLMGRYMFDCDHHPSSKGSSGGSDWPVNLRHGTVMAVDANNRDSWKLMTPFEHFAAMGFLVFPDLYENFGRFPLTDFLKTFSASQLKKFLGNGMHLVTQCAWMFYVLGNTSLKDRRAGVEGSDVFVQ